MTEIGSKVLLYLFASLAINGISYGLRSSFLPNFIDGNLITILLALMAINSTTNSVILTKLKDLTKDLPDEKKKVLNSSMKEMKISIVEQLVLIAIAIIGLILKKSDVLKLALPHRDFAIDLILVAVLFYSIHVLYDTANAVFVIIDSENKPEGAS